ncbi:FAD-dependent oxidoreductase [Hydrogenophaga sp. 2FB]|uniref:NAD(P)/FAD-dependent oxidoreductase n=1 Tax=Hydrogenophaga sp. 2FB TaxID=2502187 RepID=UPI0010F71CBB|nr:FAD-dependent oxidoreductase [Hydrogenophaga sp. 2FB]
MSTDKDVFDVAVIGAGNVGIAVAYYLMKEQNFKRVALIDPRDPMSLTSAQSGENYRNWWPHPTMTAFTDHSIRLMEQIDANTGGRLNMTRGGYALVTRRERPEDLIEDLYRGYEGTPEKIRIRESATSDYAAPLRSPWQSAPDGVDVLLNTDLIRQAFPMYAQDVRSIIHIRRAGSISAQQLGQHMLEDIRAAGGTLIRAELKGVVTGQPFQLDLAAESGATTIRAERIVNAAGPYLRDVGQMLGEDLPVTCVYQQKIAFQDREAAISRAMPFTIDLDGQTLAWSDEDRALLASDPDTRKLVEPMPGGIHCRPDGPVDGNWIKLGWAYNSTASDPHAEDPVDPQFPDSVLRAASRLHPKLAAYIGKLPRGAHHYGGYYAMTEENWPLIGPMGTQGAFIAGALSGFGSMAACATGSLCAAWVAGKPVPAYAASLSMDRYKDAELMSRLKQLGSGSL